MTLPASIRVGAVNYLNTRPLVYRFAELIPQGRLVLDVPSRLADDLEAGRLDIALIPSIEFRPNAGYTIVSDACIGCRGPVLSVKLFFRVPPAQVASLALDEGSRTSAVLAQILLAERYSCRPRLERLPLGASPADTRADAVLLIGDRAIHAPPGEFVESWDLGDQWCRFAELPFVFAMWVARPGLDTGGIEPALAQCRDLGVANLEQIAAQEAAALTLEPELCLRYLRENLYFYLGPRQIEGLELYYRLARKWALAPAGVELGCFDCKSAR